MSESRPIANALQILEALSHSEGLSLAELSRKCGVPKPTALRYLREMIAQGYAHKDESDGTYSLGAKILELARGYREQFDPLSAARNSLRELADITGETSHLGILRDSSIVFIDLAESKQTLRAFVDVGEKLPIHCVASGLAVLAFSGEALAKKILAKPVQKFTAKTIVSKQALVRELAVIRRNGYATADGLWKDDVVGISAPILGNEGAVLGAIGVALPKSRATTKRVAELGKIVKQFAEKFHVNRVPNKHTRVVQHVIHT